MSELISPISDDTFAAEVLTSDTPVLVDFWAEWCGPCKTLAPLLQELANEYQGRVKIVKLDVSENQKIATEYLVRSIPTLILFKNGEVESSVIGVQSKGAFTQMLDLVV